MDRLTRLVLFLMLSLVGLSWRTSASAAGTPTLEFISPVGIIRTDDIIPVEVAIDSGGKVMNAVDLTLTYPSDQMRVERIQREQSAFPLWPEAPAVDEQQGTIHLVAGRPGGVVAIHARIATVYVRVQVPGKYTMGADGQQSGMFLNDGAGSKTFVTPTDFTLTVRDQLYQGITIESPSHPDRDRWSTLTTVRIHWDVHPNTEYSYQLSTDPQATPDTTPDSGSGDVTYADLADGRYSFTLRSRTGSGPWSEVNERRFLIDQTPPDPFSIQMPDPEDVDGQTIVTWTATDAMSGLDRIEGRIGNRQLGSLTSPLRLERDWRGKTLTLTAYDQAGNTQTSRFTYRQSSAPNADHWLLILAATALFAAGLAWWIIRRK